MGLKVRVDFALRIDERCLMTADLDDVRWRSIDSRCCRLSLLNHTVSNLINVIRVKGL